MRTGWPIAFLLVACGSPTTAGEPPAAHAEVAIDPVVRAACEAGLGNVPGAVTLPEGVTEDRGDREAIIAAAADWTLPEGVTFELDGAARVAGDRITLRGVLVNGTAEPVDVFLSEAGAGYFTATLTGDDLVRRAMPAASGPETTPRPALFPEPHRFTLAPGARWPLETSIVLGCWELERPRTVTAHWWLSVHGEPREGELPVALP